MMSLRSFHLVFLLFAIVVAELFGGWAVHHYAHTHDRFVLALGLVTFGGSFAVIGYALWFVRKMDRAHIQ
jgi:DNA-binding transcriptional regulator of glucitol operon